MKKFKKIVSILLTAIMVLAMCVPVMADTVNNTTGHTYKAYQIFSGFQTASDATLTGIKWGTDVNSTGIINALKTDTTNYPGLSGNAAKTGDAAAVYIAECLANDSTLADSFAKVVAANLSSTGGTSVDSNATSSVDLSAGYYLFVDQTTYDKDNLKDDVIGLSLLQVTKNGDIEIKAKVEKPSVEKKVYEEKVKNSETDYGAGYNDTADYNIGDAVPFKLIGTVVDMSKFNTYKYEFHDTMATSLTLNSASIEVYAAYGKNTMDEKIYSGYTTIEYPDSNSFAVKFEDLKSTLDGLQGEDYKYIIVTYTANLNENAAIGNSTIGNTGEGNVNEVYLKYSNNPNQGGEGAYGKTPEDKVIVFTYELDGTKVDKTNNSTKLAGAEFVLYKSVTNGESGSTNYYVTLNNDKKVSGWVTDKAGATTITSDSNGLFKIIGLDDGTYFLEETKAPAGYNILSTSIKIKITADTTNGQAGSGLVTELKTVTVSVDDEVAKNGTNGVVTITVENNKGSILPETGGMGTTIFYTVGVILMLGAGVLLVTKKRMGSSH